MLVNKTKSRVLAEDIEEAKTIWKKAKGLIGRIGIDSNYAMIIHDCQGIHTWLMRFEIDVIMLDRDRRVIEKIRNIKPWRVTDIRKERKYVIEKKASSLPEWLEIGDQLDW